MQFFGNNIFETIFDIISKMKCHFLVLYRNIRKFGINYLIQSKNFGFFKFTNFEKWYKIIILMNNIYQTSESLILIAIKLWLN
jgi:hypothetical protein